jgi:phosphoribosyl 1,2-cyclic phosphodiesterase
MDIRFWGMRGGVPRSSKDNSRYGGNTACVEVRCGETLIIIDAGSGLVNLGMALMTQLQDRPLEAHLFLSHTHWDHIIGLPYFQPAYRSPGKITVYGVAGTEELLPGLFRGALAGEFFPIPDGKASMEVVFQELKEKTMVGEATMSYCYLNHPGLTLGFRLEYEGKTLVYMSDNEPYRVTNRALVKDDDDNRYLSRMDLEAVQFARGADLLIADASYSEEEYPSHSGEGLSSARDALQIGLTAQAHRLVLFHYSPFYSDGAIDQINEKCRQRIISLKSKLEILQPAEGDLVQI